MKDISASTVAEALLQIFSRVGLPYQTFIQTEDVDQFTSEMIREVYRLLDVKQSTTTPYHAMGNGVIENFNKTIKNFLKVAAERPKDWYRYLGPLMPYQTTELRQKVVSLAHDKSIKRHRQNKM